MMGLLMGILWAHLAATVCVLVITLLVSTTDFSVFVVVAAHVTTGGHSWAAWDA